MKKLISSIILLISSVSLFAYETPAYEWYSWERNRTPAALTEAESKEGGVIMLDKRIVEMSFINNITPVIYYTKHNIVRLNTDYAIEYYNKIYIPMSNVISLVEMKARFISKDGKIHDMETDNVKDIDNYNNNGPYKIYAFEGIEIGGEIEFIYTVKQEWRGIGTETYRSIYNYRTIELDILSPEYIKYDAKSYNGLEPCEEDGDGSKYGDRERFKMRSINVEGYEDEAYSSSSASYPRVEYKFAYNTYGGSHKRMNTWDDAANTFYPMIYSSTPNEKRMAHMLLKEMGDKSSMSTADRIRLIENYVKANFSIRGDAEGDKYETVAGIIKSHVGTDVGIMKLYAALFEQAKIKMQIVLTSDRFHKRFDGEFDSWTYLQYFLIYFPETEKYIAPSANDHRYGFIPAELCGQDGLFIASDENSPLKKTGYIQYIQETTWEQNFSALKVHMTFDLGNGLANVTSFHSYTGHSAAFIQPYLMYMSKEDALESMEGILSIGAADARPRNLKYSGYENDKSFYWEPFTVSGDFTTNSFLEHTCTNFIFKIGEVIGTQYNMYDKEERRTDVTLNFAHGFRREIEFEIPAGYKVINLSALNSDVSDDSLNPTMKFHSWYTQEGNTVKVFVEENYSKVTYPKEVYEDFRAVMNASADFNKVVLFFEKI